MSDERAPIPAIDLTDRDDVRQALDLLLARAGAIQTTIDRLNHYVQHDLLEAAWSLAAHTYGTHPEGGLADGIHDRIDPLEEQERARLVERIAREHAP